MTETSSSPQSRLPVMTVQHDDNDDDSLPLDPTSPVTSTLNPSPSSSSSITLVPPSTSPDDHNSIFLSRSDPDSKSSSVYSSYHDATSTTSPLKPTSASPSRFPLSPQLPDLSKILVQFCFTHPILESFSPCQQFLIPLQLDEITEVLSSPNSSDSYFCLKPGWKFNLLLPKFLDDIRSFFTLWQLPTNLFYKFKSLLTDQSSVDHHFNIHVDCFLPNVDKPEFGILSNHPLFLKFWDQVSFGQAPTAHCLLEICHEQSQFLTSCFYHSHSATNRASFQTQIYDPFYFTQCNPLLILAPPPSSLCALTPSNETAVTFASTNPSVPASPSGLPPSSPLTLDTLCHEFWTESANIKDQLLHDLKAEFTTLFSLIHSSKLSDPTPKCPPASNPTETPLQSGSCWCVSFNTNDTRFCHLMGLAPTAASSHLPPSWTITNGFLPSTTMPFCMDSAPVPSF